MLAINTFYHYPISIDLSLHMSDTLCVCVSLMLVWYHILVSYDKPFDLRYQDTNEVEIIAAWLMCDWTFSPYHAHWWSCKIFDIDGNATCLLVQPIWKHSCESALPDILNQPELAKRVAHLDLSQLQWCIAPYTVAWPFLWF